MDKEIRGFLESLNKEIEKPFTGLFRNNLKKDLDAGPSR